jgi:hypothetical protein
VNFRFNNDADEADYGQPATYGAVSQDLRKVLDESKKGKDWDTARPWELNSQGKVSVQLTKDKAAELKLVSSDRGYGVAKGKTYFHQLGSWAVPPNMFDPFWRAKLQPFVRDELKEVLTRAGDFNGVQIVSNSSSAIEGVVK